MTCFRFILTIAAQHSLKDLPECPSTLLESKVHITCTPFSITYSMCKQWKNCQNYSPCPEDCWEVDIPKDIITGPFNNAEQISSLKISIGYVFWGTIGLGEGGWLPSIHFWLLERGTKTTDFQSNDLHPVRSLYDHPFHKNLECPGAQLTTLAHGLWGDCVHPKNICYMIFGTIGNKMAISQFQSNAF